MRGVLHRYGDRLPIGPDTPLISLGEGDTPLVRSRRLARARRAAASCTSSSRCATPPARSRTAAWSSPSPRRSSPSAKAVLCASTGNTSASAAAYAAHCGLEAYVLVPHGNIAQGKLAQAVAHGAQILNVRGNFDDALRLARVISEQHPVALVNSVNPHRIEGQKTAAFEIVDALGDAPDLLFIPVGNAGNITAYWRGFVEYYQAEQASKKPRMMGWQAAGAAPIVTGELVEDPQTVASAIRIGNPASWRLGRSRARRVRRRDQRRHRRRDPRGLPPAGAGRGHLLRARLRRLRRRPAQVRERRRRSTPRALSSQTVVCIITGHGLKDPETALGIDSEMREVEPRIEAIEEAMGL